MINILRAWFDQGSVRKYEKKVKEINALEEAMKALSPEDLRNKTNEFRERLQNGATTENLLVEAFAVVREASRRTLGERHYDVQLLGGAVIHGGNIAEMRTGEGKTLVATLPVYLNALLGEGVHVVTVNDYLSRRDAVWMGQIYHFLGMSIGVIGGDNSYLYDPAHSSKVQDETRDHDGSFKVVHEYLRPVSRREAYAADITYGTNSEFGFDYLRDNIEHEKGRLRQRGHAFAIVDEIDSILIDEARTPLIISAPAGDSEKLYQFFARLAHTYIENEDYKVDEKFRSIALTDSGVAKAEKALNVENIYTDKGIKYVHHLETAVKAKALYKKDKEYVVKDNEVIIVDTFTGRLQPGRRWSEGLHQAIEAKENVMIQKESRTYASITYQNYFRLYKKLSGMTGTALTSKEEFYRVYGLDTIAIPTHRQNARIDHDDLMFQTETGKYKALARKVKELQEKGQPVLVGTVSIEKNEQLSGYLTRAGVRHEVLNAKNHEKEGEIIARAGIKGSVTVATNMAGRGVDIKLGGPGASKEEAEAVRNLGGLYVIGTERHEARRIDNQLRGRSGRQGDPGETQFYVSLEDDLMRIFASDMVKSMMGKLGIAEDEPVRNALVTRSLESAQKKIEGFHFDSRKHVLEFDDVLNYQRKIMYERRQKMLLGDKETIHAELNNVLINASPEEDAQIKAKAEELGPELFTELTRRIILQTIDTFWIEHLELMDYLRNSVNLRAYGQRDPLTEYKKEGLRLFKEMEAGIYSEIIRILPLARISISNNEEKGDAMPTPNPSSASDMKEVGRNDPCPCGSGKKYKKCHGIVK